MTKKRSSKLLSWLLTLAMVLSLAAGMSITAFAQDNDIIVLYTNDVHCGVDDNIGYAGLALYKKQMQQQTPYVILADAGDAIQGAPIGTLSEGGYLVDIMNQVGYDFAIPGNHEFDYGMNRFLELAGKLDCGYYSSNFVDLRTGNTVFAPYKMFTFGDVKVALVGASTPESFTKSTPSYFQNENGTYVYGFCEDESGESLYAKIQSSVDAARNDGAAYVILVGHLGENGTTERWSSDAVIAHTNGIDAVIDGHSHETVPNKTIANKDGKQIPLTQTGTKLKNIGKLTIKADGTITTELVDKVPAKDTTSSYSVKTGDSLSRIAKSQLGSASRWKEIYDANRDKIRNKNLLYAGMKLTIPGSVRVTEDGKAVDAQTDSYIKSIQAIYQESLKTVLGHTDVDLTDKNLETGERAVRNAETNLGDLTADAYRYELGAEIGLSNGGGIRSFIAAGNITYENTLAVFPYGNMACLIEVTGQQLKDALEMASKNYPQESGGFLQVSGVTYTIDSTVLSSVKLDDKGNFLGVSGAYRVTDIQVNGQPLDLNLTYTLASHNYMLKDSGDGINMFADNKLLQDSVMLDNQVLINYIKDSLGGIVPATYAAPQGRITVIATPYTDVLDGNWAVEAVNYVTDKNFMKGLSETTFGPNGALTRGMLVTVLYRMAGSPEVTGKVSEKFTDCTDGSWYADAVLWASAHKIVDGYEDGTYKPTKAISRQEMAKVLYGYDKIGGKTADGITEKLTYTDVDAIGEWALESVTYCTAAGYLAGSNGAFNPKGTATRAMGAKVLMNMTKEAA